MRLRLLAFVPPAALVTTILLVSTTSFVSALEASFLPDTIGVVEIHRYESECQKLERQIREVSRQATGCDADLHCLGSPILCPIAMDDASEFEYRMLRDHLGERCGAARGGIGDGLGEVFGDGFRPSHFAPISCQSSVDSPTRSIGTETFGPATFVF